MKRTTLFALTSALSLSASMYAYGNASSANDSEWSKSTLRVERMNDQQREGSGLAKQAQDKLSPLGKDVGTADGQMNRKTEQALTDQSGSAATGGSSSGSQDDYTPPKPSDSD
jgi:hypothetical protein